MLYPGENENKYDHHTNVIIDLDFQKAVTSDLSKGAAMGNPDVSEAVMLRQVDFDEHSRQILPDAPAPEDLQEFRVEPERHQTYATLWRWTTYLNLIANTAFWLSF